MRQYDIHPDVAARDTVREALDLSAILGVYKGEQGQLPYHPGMLVALLLYGYSLASTPAVNWRVPARAVDVMAVTGLNRPDFRTISDFRKRHLLRCRIFSCRCCGCVGPRVWSSWARGGRRHQAARQRQPAQGDELPAHGAPGAEAGGRGTIWLDQAAATDAAEDAQYGTDRLGDEPGLEADKQRAWQRIAGQAQWEAEAAAGPYCASSAAFSAAA